MKKIYCLPIVAAMLVSVGAAAQNLNPTVSVTRTYEGKLMDVHKPMETMAVADSMSRFDLDFDYSVFDNPYRGAYDSSLMNFRCARRTIHIPDAGFISRPVPDTGSGHPWISSGNLI